MVETTSLFYLIQYKQEANPCYILFDDRFIESVTT